MPVSLFVSGKEGNMNESVREFREEHGCKYCLYYKSQCDGNERCVFDYLPIESLEEDVELFLMS